MGDAVSSQKPRPGPKPPRNPPRPPPAPRVPLDRSGVYEVPDHVPCPPNQTLFQGFEWYIPPDRQHWTRLTHILPTLAALGVSRMWIPPAAKAAHPTTNGYDVYDLYDLGEFDQKGATPTKWGPKDELQRMVRTAAENGVGVLFDAVMNHKAAADHTERVVARKVDPEDRRKLLGEPHEIEAWCKFTFPGRGGRHSAMQWHKEHFNSLDWDNLRSEQAIWKFEGKEWAQDVSAERGNYDYLMFCNIDHTHLDVRAALVHWAEWLPTQLGPGLAGLRLDAIKHYSRAFLRDFVDRLDRTVGRDWFYVGEYWDCNSETLARYIDDFPRKRMHLFDVRLCDNFSKVSMQEGSDLRTVFDEALCLWRPSNAVSFVVNHDTQDGQALYTPVAPFFIPHAYALILLRLNAGLPCVFWADLYGSITGSGREPSSPSIDPSKFRPPTSGGQLLPRLMLARRLWAYGTQADYFADDPLCVGFTRAGHPSQSGGAGLAVVMTTAWEFRTKTMRVGRRHAGGRWTDVLRACPGMVVIDGDGTGVFPCAPRSVSVWVPANAPGREYVDGFVFDWDVYGLRQKR